MVVFSKYIDVLIPKPKLEIQKELLNQTLETKDTIIGVVVEYNNYITDFIEKARFFHSFFAMHSS